MTREDLYTKVGKTLEKANKMNAKEWEDAYLDLATDYEQEIVIGECMDEAIVQFAGEEALVQIADHAAEMYNEIVQNENYEPTPEEQAILDDLF